MRRRPFARFDALRLQRLLCAPKGQAEFGTRTEIKNVNSFRNVERAIESEIARQMDILEDGGRIVQETRLYDADKNETRSMRSKEVANDYRYFPCPDLLPVVIDDNYIQHGARHLPELPDAKRARFLLVISGLSAVDAGVLSANRDLAHYFETAAKDSQRLQAGSQLGARRCLRPH